MLSKDFLDELDAELVNLQAKAENDKLGQLNPGHVAEVVTDARAVIAELIATQEAPDAA